MKHWAIAPRNPWTGTTSWLCTTRPRPHQRLYPRLSKRKIIMLVAILRLGCRNTLQKGALISCRMSILISASMSTSSGSASSSTGSNSSMALVSSSGRLTPRRSRRDPRDCEIPFRWRGCGAIQLPSLGLQYGKPNGHAQSRGRFMSYTY